MQERMGGGAEQERGIPVIEDVVVQTPKGMLPAAEAIGLLQNATALSAGDGHLLAEAGGFSIGPRASDGHGATITMD